MKVITVKYLSGHRKHIYEVVDVPKEHPNRFFIDKELANKVIIDFRTTAAHKCTTRLRFKQYDVILTKEQPVLINTKNSFAGETRKHKIVC